MKKYLPRNNNGLTLMELVVTIGVISILSAAALPVCKPLVSKYRMNSAARGLANNLLWARLKAVSQQNNLIIQFYAPHDDGEYKYEIFSDDNYNGVRDQGEERREIPLEKGIIFASDSGQESPLGDLIQVTDGITFTSNRIVFTPRGAALESGEIYLVPQDDASPSVSHSRSKAITITNATGRVKIWKFSPESSPGPWA